MNSNGFSLDILSILKDRYGNWVDSDLIKLRIIQKSGDIFLEATYRSDSKRPQSLVREKLNFIIEDIDAETNEEIPLFPVNQSANENAERFFDKIDLYSIIMTGIVSLFFLLMD